MSDLLIACRHNNGFIKLSLTSGCAFMLQVLVARFCIAP